MTTTIQFDPLGTTACLLTSSTVQHSVDNEDHATTTITSLATTLSSSIVKPQVVYMQETYRYVDSLSDQELVEMVQLLENKEQEFIIEEPKTYTKQ